MTGVRRQGTSREGTQENVRSRSRGGVFGFHSHRVTGGWGWGADVKQCPRGGTCCLDRGATSALAHTQQALAGQGWRPMRSSASWALQLRKAISFATAGKVRKAGCQ